MYWQKHPLSPLVFHFKPLSISLLFDRCPEFSASEKELKTIGSTRLEILFFPSDCTDRLLRNSHSSSVLMQRGFCVSSGVLLDTEVDYHRQWPPFPTSSSHSEFPTILSTTETEQTINVCPSGLHEPMIVLLGTNNSTLGAVTRRRFCSEGPIILALHSVGMM